MLASHFSPECLKDKMCLNPFSTGHRKQFNYDPISICSTVSTYHEESNITLLYKPHKFSLTNSNFIIIKQRSIYFLYNTHFSPFLPNNTFSPRNHYPTVQEISWTKINIRTYVYDFFLKGSLELRRVNVLSKSSADRFLFLFFVLFYFC